MKNNEPFEETFLFNFFLKDVKYMCVYIYKYIFSEYRSLIYILYHIFKRVNNFFGHIFFTCHVTVTWTSRHRPMDFFYFFILLYLFISHTQT